MGIVVDSNLPVAPQNHKQADKGAQGGPRVASGIQ